MEAKDELLGEEAGEATATSMEVETELISRPTLTLNSSIDENIITME